MARFQERPTLSQAQIDTSSADVARSLSATLQNFSQRIGQERAVIVQDEAFKEGFKLAQAGEVVPEENAFSLKDKAFNKGLFTAYKANMDNDSRLEISRIAQENPADVAKFRELSESYKSSVIANVPEEFRAEITQSLDDQIARTEVQIQGNTIERTRNEVLQDLQQNVDLTFEESSNLMRLGDDIGAEQEKEKAFSYIDAMDIAEADKSKMKQAYSLELTEQKYKGEGDRLYEKGGIKAVNDWLTKNEGKPKGGTTPDEWDAITDAIQTDANRKESRKNARRTGSLKDARASLKNYEIAKSLGYEVSRKEEMELNAKIAGTDLVDKKRVIDKTASFSVMSAEERDAILLGIDDAGEKGELPLDEIPLAASLQKANGEINKLAEKDGYTLGAKQGIIEFSPLELGNPESFAVRLDQAELLSEHYGMPISPLSDAEAQSVADNLDNMTVQEKIQLAQTFQESPSVWGQLDKKNAGNFAMAGATGDIGVMTSVFKGQELISQKLVKNLSTTDYLPVFEDATEGVYEPRDKRALLDSVLSYYAATSASAVDGIFNEGDFQNAIQAVSGGIAEINGGMFGGFKIELPRGVSQDDYQDFIDDLQPETIADWGGIDTYTNEQAVEAIQQGRIRNIGSNRYIVEVNGGTLFSNGEPFEFSYDLDVVTTNQAIANMRQAERRRKARGR